MVTQLGWGLLGWIADGFAEGITRELFALLGERAPPIAINENRYKGRPKWMSKLRVRPWCVYLAGILYVVREIG